MRVVKNVGAAESSLASPDGAADPPLLRYNSALGRSAEQLFDAVNKSSYDKRFDQVFHVMLG